MRKWLSIVACALLLASCGNSESKEGQANVDGVEQTIVEGNYTSDSELQKLYDQQIEGEQIFIKSTVQRILADDNEGSRHQKFIVELKSGQTLLVAHNIDIAPRVKGLKEGDEVVINGQYEWSDRGGVVHWTHHDPDGDHVDGWIEHNSTIYD